MKYRCEHGDYWRDCSICFPRGFNPPKVVRERDEENTALKARLAALEEHLEKLAGFENRTAELHDVGKIGNAVSAWLAKAREILRGE